MLERSGRSIKEIRNNIVGLISEDWSNTNTSTRKLFIYGGGTLAAIFIFIIIVTLFGDLLINSLYHADTSSAFGQFFSKLAENANTIPADLYANKLSVVMRRVTIFYFIILAIFILLSVRFVFITAISRTIPLASALNKITYENTFATFLLVVFIVLSYTSMQKTTLTNDESKHYRYGMQILNNNANRYSKNDSKMPISALNALPAKAAPYFPSGGMRSYLQQEM